MQGYHDLKVNRIAVLTLLPLLIPITLFAGSATAITGNPTVDQTPYVGVVALFTDIDRTIPKGYCSGFLISPTVMITAGHSLIGVVAVSVCFDQAPSFTVKNAQIIYNGDDDALYNGVPASEQFPYNPTLVGNQEFQTSDIGAIILDRPVEEVTKFAPLPPAGFTDSLQAKTDLTIIGYGMQAQTTPKNSGLQKSWFGEIAQLSAQVEFVPSNFCGSEQYLKLTANPSQGKGAVSFGDSGGPVIYDDIVVGLNAFVSSSNCNGVSYHTRIDTPEVLGWIYGYLLHE